MRVVVVVVVTSAVRAASLGLFLWWFHDNATACCGLVKGGLEKRTVHLGASWGLEFQENVGAGVDGLGGSFAPLTEVVVRAIAAF